MDNLHAGYPVEIACYLILSTLLGRLLDCWHPRTCCQRSLSYATTWAQGGSAVSLRLSKGKRLAGRRRKFALRVLLISGAKSHHMLWPRVCGLHIKYLHCQISRKK
jgi:hypothetical protein